MATASPVHPSAVSARPIAQFGQSRGVTLNASSSNATTTAHAHPTSTTAPTNPPELTQMAQVTRPTSGQHGDRTPAILPPKAAPQNHTQSKASPRVGQLDVGGLTSNALIEGVLGPNKDGRVRNPVPSKLKGKTDNKQGNFGVMHMGTSPGKKTEAQARDSAAERDAAARRTSENTASRAKAAQSEKYIPPKKRGLEATLNDPANRGSPFAVSKNDDRNRARPLAPDETKFEQARLLTLLRSINPVTVVDQICKAVAYFGGIPGAPPPEDGIFPESANTRETGALFIGWVAEIFPDLASRSPEVSMKDAPVVAGKKKSRPSTNKKGGVEAVEKEPPSSRNGYGFGPAVSAPAWGLPPSLGMGNTPIPVPVAVDASHNSGLGFEQPLSEQKSSTPARPQPQETNAEASSKRRRGRPKGSTNKKGKGDAPEGEVLSTNDADISLNGSMIDQQLQQSPQMTLDSANAFTGGYPNIMDQMSTQKPTQSYQYPTQSWSSAQKSQGSHVASQPDELSPEERAVLEAFRHPVVDNSSNNTVSAPVAPMTAQPQTVAEAGVVKKRKRAPNKSKAVTSTPTTSASTALNVGSQIQDTQSSGTQLPGESVSLGPSQEPVQWNSGTTATPVLPPAKKARIRKPKAPAPPKENTAKSQVVPALNNSTPTVTPSTIADIQSTTPQQPPRPPAEGLEAHYERFANLQQNNLQQQNGRSHTPTQTQHQRQQSKPGSVPPQQTTPMLPQQQIQMQQQKSSQGTVTALQKEDQKLSQNSSSARNTSANFYNPQRAQSTSYNQQYSTQQSTQLYGGHQASPQLNTNTLSNSSVISNNSNNNSNTMNSANSLNNNGALGNATTAASNYNRTYGAHSLAQASPQFGQQEASYRTASPHTIAQPSPSYAHNDNNFRTNSHTLTQPSSYSQAENPYRAPTTHSLTQPTNSYAASRTHSQPQTAHQNHYNNFSDAPFLDLPTLESLGHGGNSGSSSNVGMAVGGYGQGIGVGQSTSRATGGTNLYGTSSGLTNSYDNGSHDILRGVGRSAGNANAGGYGASASEMGYFHKRA